MAKLTGFESYLVIQGLNDLRDKMVLDIIEIERNGKNPLMTKEYVKITIEEVMEKILLYTYKTKR
jgi:hypothetical protein